MVSCDVTLSPAGAPAGAASGSPEPVVGSFVEDGLVFAVTGEGQVRLVASDPAALLVGGATAEGVSDAVSPDVGAEGGLGDSEPGADLASPDAGAGSSAPSAIALPVAVAHDGASYELASIGPHAFDGCGAAAARIPAGISAIDPAALASATLERVEVDSANPAFASFDGALYDADRSCLLSIPGGRKGAVRIPDNTEEVSPSAFSHAAGVDAISVDAGGNAFASWDGLLYDASGATLLRVPPGVGSAAIREGCTAIAAGALAGCASLRSIQAPATVASISPDVFEEGPEAVAAPAQAPSRGEGAVGEGAASQGRLDSLVALFSVGDAEAQATPEPIAVTLPEGGDDAPWRERGFVLGDDEGRGVPTAAKKETASARAGLTGFYRADGSTMTGPYQWLTHHYSDGTTNNAGLTNITDVWGVGYLSKFGRDDLGFWTITTEADSPPMNQDDYWATARCYMSLEKFTSGRELSDYTLMDVAYYKYGSDSSEEHYLTSTQGTVPWTENLFVYLTPGKACKMTWDANGGTVVDATGAKVGKDTRWGGAGSKEGYAIPVPERAGYVFEGWWTEKEGGTPVWWATACATNKWHPDAAALDRTVYAHWSESDATLLHASDPESTTGASSLLVSGDRVVQSAGGSVFPAHPTQWASMERTEHGLLFTSSYQGRTSYWSTSAYDAAKPLLSSYVTYDVAYVTVGDGEPIEPEVGWRLPAATGVRAYLTPGKACKMTWDANGTSYDGPKESWAGEGRDVTAPTFKVDAGYRFGWYDAPDGGKLIAKGGDSITLKKERTTCYAKVEAIDYTVSFDVSSQPEDEAHPTPPLGDRTLTVEDGLVELEEPERMPGYAFVGWALASDPANTSLVRREEGAGGAAPRWLLDASKLPDCAGKEDEVQLVARWTAVIEVAAPMQVTFLYDQGLQGQDRTAWAEGGAYLANGSAVALKVVGLESQASAGARDVIQGIDWTPGAAKLLTLAVEPDGRGGDELTASQPASGSFGSDGYVDFALDDLLFEADVAPAAITVPSNGRRDVGFRLNLSATGAVIDYSKLASLGDGGGSVTSQGGMVGRPTALAQVRLTFGYA